MSRFRRGSNSRPSACKADVITATLRNPSYRPCIIYCINSNTLHIYWDWFHTIFIKTIFFTLSWLVLRCNLWNSKFHQRSSNDRLFIHRFEFTVSCKEKLQLSSQNALLSFFVLNWHSWCLPFFLGSFICNHQVMVLLHHPIKFLCNMLNLWMTSSLVKNSLWQFPLMQYQDIRVQQFLHIYCKLHCG